VNGNVMQRRNRLSYAILHQVSGEYRGKFGGLTVNAGVRVPFFKRNLNQYCFTNRTGGYACFGTIGRPATLSAANPYVKNTTTGLPPTNGAPQQRIFTYSKPLPSVGATFAVNSNVGIFANYSKGLQVPGTDNLYNSFYFPWAMLRQAQPGIDRQLRPACAIVRASSWPRFRPGTRSTRTAWRRPSIVTSTPRSTGTWAAWTSTASTARWRIAGKDLAIYSWLVPALQDPRQRGSG
jgi:hypothetical protein